MERLAPLEMLIELIFNSVDLADKLACISKDTVPLPVAEILDKTELVVVCCCLYYHLILT